MPGETVFPHQEINRCTVHAVVCHFGLGAWTGNIINLQNYLRNWIFSVKPIKAFTGYSQSRGYGDISADDSLNKVWQTEGIVLCITSLHLVYYYVILFHISFGFPYGYVLYAHFLTIYDSFYKTFMFMKLSRVFNFNNT